MIAFISRLHGQPKFIIGIALIFLLTACTGTDEMHWKEQAWLHDGQLVLLDRSSKRNKSGFSNSRRGSILSQEIGYEPTKFLWKVNGALEQPISFDIIDGATYLVVTSPYKKEQFCNGKSNGAYIAVFYRWKNGNKQEVTQEETPIDRMANNISGISQWGYEQKSDKSFLSWSDVADATGQQRAGPPTSLNKFFAKRNWLRCG